MRVLRVKRVLFEEDAATPERIVFEERLAMRMLREEAWRISTRRGAAFVRYVPEHRTIVAECAVGF